VSVRTNSAAFFDLDKTIIAKSSVLAFGRSFYREGLLSRRSIVKSLYAQVVFMLVGADEQKMEKLRVAMAAITRGWNRDHVASIVRETLTDVIEPIIYAEALELFDEHHAAGRKVVIVSSAPLEVVQPLSEFLGADEAIGTRPDRWSVWGCLSDERGLRCCEHAVFSVEHSDPEYGGSAYDCTEVVDLSLEFRDVALF